MAAVVTPPITAEQFLQFEAPEGYRAELICGEIVLSPDPKPLDHDVVENIVEMLKKAVGRGFKVGSRCNMNIQESFSMPSPDVFVVPQEVWRAARQAGVYPSGAPLLAVEVLSPSNRLKHVKAKIEIYLAAGSLEVWTLDMKVHRVTVHRKGGAFTLGVNESIQLPAPLSSIEVSISSFFQLS